LIDLRTKQGWEDLKRILDDRVGDVLSLCGLDMPRRNGWTLIDDPRGDGRECFGLCLRADGLAWKKFNGTEKGRALELIAYCHGWYHLDKRGAEPAANLAMQRLGLGNVSAEQLERDRAYRRKRQARQAEADSHNRRDKKAAPRSPSSPAPSRSWARRPSLSARCARHRPARRAVHRPARRQYRAGLACASCRGIAISRATRSATCRRDLCAVRWWPAAPMPKARSAPCIRWLAPDGSDKADIPPAPDGTAQPARKVLGEFAGLVIPLWRGDGHLSVKEKPRQWPAADADPDRRHRGRAVRRLAAPQHRVWAMISLSNMSNVAARAARLHRQRHRPSPKRLGQAIGRCRVRSRPEGLQRGGRIVVEVEAVQGKDLNDTHRGVGELQAVNR
jgi:hypothetical protein